MKQFMLALGVLLAGTFVLSPAIAALDPDSLPGDLAFRLGQAHITLPLAYSLCASMGLTLLYYVTKG